MRIAAINVFKKFRSEHLNVFIPILFGNIRKSQNQSLWGTLYNKEMVEDVKILVK